jgi:hypothetical protein
LICQQSSNLYLMQTEFVLFYFSKPLDVVLFAWQLRNLLHVSLLTFRSTQPWRDFPLHPSDFLNNKVHCHRMPSLYSLIISLMFMTKELTLNFAQVKSCFPRSKLNVIFCFTADDNPRHTCRENTGTHLNPGALNAQLFRHVYVNAMLITVYRNTR